MAPGTAQNLESVRDHHRGWICDTSWPRFGRRRSPIEGREVNTPTEPPIAVSNLARIGLALAVAAYVYCFSYLTLRNHAAFGTWTFDFGVFDQGLWLLSRLKAPFVTLRGLNLFGDHTSFILIALAPLARIFDPASVLLVTQATALGLAALPIFLLSRRVLRSENLALAISGAYLLNPAIGWTNQEQFHPDAFEIPLFLLALCFIHKAQIFLACLSVLLLVKEDVPLLTLGLGLYVAMRHDRKVGLITMGLSVLWLAASFLIILPAINGEGSQHAGRIFDRFGGVAGTLRTVLLRPWEVAAIAIGYPRPWYLWQLVAPFALLPLLAPGIVLIALGPLLVNLISSWGYNADIHFHYSTLILPVLPVASAVGISRFESRHVRRGLAMVLLAAALTSAYLWSPVPLARDSGFHSTDPSTPQARAAREAIGLIPGEAAVSAQYAFTSHLAYRERIYDFPNPWRASNYGTKRSVLPSPETIEYVLVSPTGAFDAFGIFTSEENLRLIQELESCCFERIFSREGISLFKRRGVGSQ